MEQLDGSWERAALSETMVGNRETGSGGWKEEASGGEQCLRESLKKMAMKAQVKRIALEKEGLLTLGLNLEGQMFIKNFFLKR